MTIVARAFSRSQNKGKYNMTVEIAAKDCVFHFNKKNLEDPTIPMWILKCAGKTFYVDHVECNIPWSTKETPNNPATKGAIKIKNALLTIDDNNHATLTTLLQGDLCRIRAMKKTMFRILITNARNEITDFLARNKIKHSPLKDIRGSCGSSFLICDINKKADLDLLTLTFYNNFRILQPNEVYFKGYEDPSLLARFENVEYYDGDEEDDEEDID